MPKESPRQQRTAGRVMHEFKHGELKSGPGGKAGKVKSRKQAIAIALNEAGASKYKSEKQNARSKAKYRKAEKQGRTGQQEKEGKSHVGARDQRVSTRAEGGKNARRRTASGKKAAATRARSGGETKAQLYQRARRQDVPNRSKMTKQQLRNALAK